MKRTSFRILNVKDVINSGELIQNSEGKNIILMQDLSTIEVHTKNIKNIGNFLCAYFSSTMDFTGVQVLEDSCYEFTPKKLPKTETIKTSYVIKFKEGILWSDSEHVQIFGNSELKVHVSNFEHVKITQNVDGYCKDQEINAFLEHNQMCYELVKRTNMVSFLYKVRKARSDKKLPNEIVIKYTDNGCWEAYGKDLKSGYVNTKDNKVKLVKP